MMLSVTAIQPDCNTQAPFRNYIFNYISGLTHIPNAQVDLLMCYPLIRLNIDVLLPNQRINESTHQRVGGHVRKAGYIIKYVFLLRIRSAHRVLKVFFSLALLLLLSGNLRAQQTPEEYLQEQERLKRMFLKQQIDSGVYWMDMGEYTLADKKFRHVLETIKGVPSDLAFFFGKNSYHLKKYKQSIDWLNKYIQLKGTDGQYSEEAVSWMRKAEADLLTERSKEVEKAGQILSSDYDIDCGPTGKVICPVCRGDHVIIKKGAFGDEYRTCPYCNDHGILTCDEYNLLMRGELKPKF